MAEYFTAKEVVEHLRQEAGSYRSEAELARAIGVSRSHLNRIMRGEKKPYGRVLHWLGYKPAQVYVAR